MNSMLAANLGQAPQLAHCPAMAAISASVSGDIGYVCVAAINASRPFTLRRQAFRFTAQPVQPSVSSHPPHFARQKLTPAAISARRSPPFAAGRNGITVSSSRIRAARGQTGPAGVHGSSGRLSFKGGIYSPACMRTIASLASCSANQASRVCATASSYEAPRFRIPCAPFRCASTSRRRNLQRRSNALGSVSASSNRLAKRSHPSTDGSGSTGNSIGSATARSLTAPKVTRAIGEWNRGGSKSKMVSGHGVSLTISGGCRPHVERNSVMAGSDAN